jgi:competence protein ComEA
MFRGLTRREHAIGVGLLLLLAGGAGVRAWMQQPRFEPAIVGSAIEHPPGQLRLEQESAPRLSESVIQGRVDINTASASLLEELPGIGPVKAQSIVQWRIEHGPFGTIEDLDRVPGIGEKTLERLRPSITVGPSPSTASPAPELVAGALAASPWAPAQQGPGIVAAPPSDIAPPRANTSPPPATGDPDSRPVRINFESEAELQDLNGIGPALAKRIVEDRARRGPFRSIDELQRVSGIGPVTIQKNRHRIVLN